MTSTIEAGTPKDRRIVGDEEACIRAALGVVDMDALPRRSPLRGRPPSA
jgi:hypothetical protein